MMNDTSNNAPKSIIMDSFEARGIEILSFEERAFPGETIFVVKVSEEDFSRATEIGNELDFEIQKSGVKGFVTIRKADVVSRKGASKASAGVGDQKATELITLLNGRSRASDVQPSLSYIPDTAFNIKTVIAHRHHLIFGRRGVGKTALMAEAKRIVVENNDVAVWVNLQTIRFETVTRAYCFVCRQICYEMQKHFQQRQFPPVVLSQINELDETLGRATRLEGADKELLASLIPLTQLVVRRFLDTTSCHLYLFIDELHYFEKAKQPILLDALHGSMRDCNAWLKIAGIRHLSRWFQSHPPLGLQTGHDADHINLDITLESPSKAKTFLEQILASYARSVGISGLSGLIITDALNRLVLASGAVPRDYLVLFAGAIRQAQRRDRARTIGVQDINKAAGEAASVKLTELDDDTSGATNGQALLAALNLIRAFCIDEKKYTFFRIEFSDKEANPVQYGLIQDLMDLRLLHLIDSSLSDQHEAGKRSEVYMLDLSQFSGQRLKKNLHALDFTNGHLVLKETGTTALALAGASPTQRIGILRKGPLFTLNRLAMGLPINASVIASDQASGN